MNELAQEEQEQAINPYDSAACLGIVSQVKASTVEIALAGNGVNLGEVNRYVIIDNGSRGLFGQISEVNLLDSGVGGQNLRPVASVQLQSTVDFTKGDVTRGVAAQPRIGANAYLAPAGLVQWVAECRAKLEPKQRPLQISFATLPGNNSAPLHFTPEMLFGRHCAVLGTTGSGKSWSMARMIEEVARMRSKVVLFDASGEYPMLTSECRHVTIGSGGKLLPGSHKVALPYYQLTENDLFAIFKPTGQSQAPKLREAMKSLKLLRLVPSLALNGTIMKANKNKQYFEAAYNANIAKLEDPSADFDISLLARQLEYECVKPTRSAMETNVWGDTSGVDYASCVPLINRISDVLGSSNLEPVFHPKNKPSVIDELNTFLADDTCRVFHISLQHLSFMYNAREITANAIGRYLLRLARDGYLRRKPLLIVVDEAHQFLNRTIGDEDLHYSLDAFALIAKEGRKYGLSICLATQRPRDIPEGVLSQMGTLLVHRLINDMDRSVVERAAGEIDRSAIGMLPVLPPGEAVLLGIDFPIPVHVRVSPPRNQPASRGPDYQRCWR